MLPSLIRWRREAWTRSASACSSRSVLLLFDRGLQDGVGRNLDMIVLRRRWGTFCTGHLAKPGVKVCCGLIWRLANQAQASWRTEASLGMAWSHSPLITQAGRAIQIMFWSASSLITRLGLSLYPREAEQLDSRNFIHMNQQGAVLFFVVCPFQNVGNDAPSTISAAMKPREGPSAGLATEKGCFAYRRLTFAESPGIMGGFHLI